MHIKDDNSFRRHELAVRATRFNLMHLDRRLGQFESCIRVLLRDRQFLALLHELGYSRLPRHIHDALK